MLCALLGSYHQPLGGPVCNGAVDEFSHFLQCPNDHCTSVPVNLVYFPEI